jgi:acetyl-CoA carboxylase biotin carboxyl carrier protein
VDDPVLLVRVEAEPEGERRAVLSPGVGWWSSHPHPGALVGPGSSIGTLAHLNRRFVLLLPEGAAGIVADSLPRDRLVAVEFGQTLLHLLAMGGGSEAGLVAEAGRLGHPAAADLPAGAWAVVSPTDGTFYTRPTPDAPPFAERGCRVRPGQPLGLVEVMKTFNQVLYGGPGFPEEAEVVEVRCGDAEEVRAGQVLFVVR